MERYDIAIQMYSADASGTQYVWEKVPAEEGDFVLYADAQATIATLQSRVKELERVRGERDHAKKMEAVQKEVADNQTWHVQKLRTLILALPKVEGEILEQGDLAFVRYVHVDGPLPDIPRHDLIALLKHRQGME